MDLILSVATEISLVFMCGPKTTCFLVRGSNYLVFVRVVQIDLVFVCWPKILGFGVSIELDFFFVWVVEVDLILLLGIELDLISV